MIKIAQKLTDFLFGAADTDYVHLDVLVNVNERISEGVNMSEPQFMSDDDFMDLLPANHHFH